MSPYCKSRLNRIPKLSGVPDAALKPFQNSGGRGIARTGAAPSAAATNKRPPTQITDRDVRVASPQTSKNVCRTFQPRRGYQASRLGLPT